MLHRELGPLQDVAGGGRLVVDSCLARTTGCCNQFSSDIFHMSSSPRTYLSPHRHHHHHHHHHHDASQAPPQATPALLSRALQGKTANPKIGRGGCYCGRTITTRTTMETQKWTLWPGDSARCIPLSSSSAVLRRRAMRPSTMGWVPAQAHY
jgi:hypothetical protein